jgi:hypothetical protein
VNGTSACAFDTHMQVKMQAKIAVNAVAFFCEYNFLCPFGKTTVTT